MNKGLGIVIALLCASTLAHAQFGISGRYFNSDQTMRRVSGPVSATDGFIVQSTPFPNNSWEIGIDYWFRLKNTRIEFLPTLSAGTESPDLDLTGSASEIGEDAFSYDHRYVSFFLNTNIYVFDLLGDCDCPTFSKSSPFFRKGFFLQLAPGLTYNHSTFEYDGGREEEQDELVIFGIGAGVGLDLGVSDLVTITPMIGGRYYPSIPINIVDVDGNTIREEQESALQYHAAIRLGFRLE